MPQSPLDRLESLITGRTGLKLRLRQRELLNRAVGERLLARGFSHLDQYYEFLQADNAVAKAEWERILSPLTNNETYFFRDRGQMTLLREQILPELIACNESKHTLRLWSAGCSTGEEAYTLAILVDELLPKSGSAERQKWHISILGTDIDEPALRRARRGVYGSWSFRNVDPVTKQRHFEPQDNGWRISDGCRSLVTFHECNLVADAFPCDGTDRFDLILCRNVFIYFEPAAVTSVLGKFAQTLCEGGYLMTGHVETSGQAVPMLETRSFPGSEVYQRAGQRSLALHLPKKRAPEATHAGPPREELIRPATVGPRPPPKAPPASSGLAKRRGVTARTDMGEAMVGARKLADLGHYDEATEECQHLIEDHPFASEAYELLASIAQEQGRADEAKQLLKKAVYLSPASPRLYIELGALYRSEGDLRRASRMEVTALDLLRKMPPHEVVGFSGGPSAAECISHLIDVSERAS